MSGRAEFARLIPAAVAALGTRCWPRTPPALPSGSERGTGAEEQRAGRWEASAKAESWLSLNTLRAVQDPPLAQSASGGLGLCNFQTWIQQEPCSWGAPDLTAAPAQPTRPRCGRVHFLPLLGLRTTHRCHPRTPTAPLAGYLPVNPVKGRRGGNLPHPSPQGEKPQNPEWNNRT